MRYLLVIILVVVLIPSVSVEGNGREWVATEPEGLCNRNGIKIRSDSIQVSEDGTFSLTFSFPGLPSRYFFEGNLLESETEITTDRFQAPVGVVSFVSESVGDAWQIKIKLRISGSASRFVNLQVCDTLFRLE